MWVIVFVIATGGETLSAISSVLFSLDVERTVACVLDSFEDATCMVSMLVVDVSDVSNCVD